MSRTEFFNADKHTPAFEGVRFSGRMEDNRLGAYCKNDELCLVAGACDIFGSHRDVVALGRWDGQAYSAWNRVPSPFLIRPMPRTSGKSSALARNIVNRLSSLLRDEKSLFRAYLMEREQIGIAYELG